MKALVTAIFLSIIGIALAGDDVATAFETAGLVPDVVDNAPTLFIEVSYGNKAVNLGNEFLLTETLSRPNIRYNHKSDAFYTLIMTDPDVPSRNAPILREFYHWHVVNIPGSDIDAGETLTAYLGPIPPAGTGPHRYTFLVFEQPGKIDFHVQPLTRLITQASRVLISTRRFASAYNLGDPIAGNYFQGVFGVGLSG